MQADGTVCGPRDDAIVAAREGTSPERRYVVRDWSTARSTHNATREGTLTPDVTLSIAAWDTLPQVLSPRSEGPQTGPDNSQKCSQIIIYSCPVGGH
jgi:hypothetical protein